MANRSSWRKLPRGITIFSDGGLELGQKTWTGMGTWGVHIPGMLVEDLPDELLDIGHAKHHPAGALVYGQALGPALSSARMEAIAFLASTAVKGAHRCGIDNKAVVRRAQKLLRGRMASSRPWGRQDDGDVWMAIHSMIQEKTREALGVTTVKGMQKTTTLQTAPLSMSTRWAMT